MNTISKLNHELLFLAKVDRLGGIDTFFGRMELFEDELGKRHETLNFDWRKPGRYGNVIEYQPTLETIDFVLQQGWEVDELSELSKWYKAQGTPDCLILSLFMDMQLKKVSQVEKQKV